MVTERWQVEAREERFAGAEQDWRLRKVQFIHQAGLYKGPNGSDTTANSDVLVFGGGLGALQCGLDSVGDKMKVVPPCIASGARG